MSEVYILQYKQHPSLQMYIKDRARIYELIQTKKSLYHVQPTKSNSLQNFCPLFFCTSSGMNSIFMNSKD